MNACCETPAFEAPTSPPPAGALKTVVLIGPPNSGKSTLFNRLTGLRQKVANYPGVTVERKEGRLRLEDGSDVPILDLPGTYSLTPGSPDEQLATDIILGNAAHTPRPNLVLCVVDASHLERNLYLVSQIIDADIPVVVALNMVDLAERSGMSIDIPSLSRSLGVPGGRGADDPHQHRLRLLRPARPV